MTPRVRKAREQGHQQLSYWFGLSYASWLTLPRVLMENMPDDWQERMAKLLHEYDAAYPNQPDLGTRGFLTCHGKLIKTPGWLINYRHPDDAQIIELRSKSTTSSKRRKPLPL